MNTKQKLKAVMQRTGMDYFTVARQSHLSVGKLTKVALGILEPDQDMVRRIRDFIEDVGLCPDCCRVPKHYGGCVQCTCGWGVCS